MSDFQYQEVAKSLGIVKGGNYLEFEPESDFLGIIGVEGKGGKLKIKDSSFTNNYLLYCGVIAVSNGQFEDQNSFYSNNAAI